MSKAAITSSSISTYLGWIMKQHLNLHEALWDVDITCTSGWSLLFTSLLLVRMDLTQEGKKQQDIPWCKSGWVLGLGWSLSVDVT